MNKTLLLSLALALPAMAGTSKQVVSEPAPAPSEWNWFVGGSAAYLFDFEEMLYTGHIGVDTPWNVGGFDVALYLEGGYTETEENLFRQVDLELDIIPITFNVKFERPIAGNLNFYMGVGAGVGLVNLDVDDFDISEDDTVFAAQGFVGLIYNFTPNFEIFGGGRYVFLDDADFDDELDGADLDLGDDFAVELGLRFTF